MVAAEHSIRPLCWKGNDGHLEETTCTEETRHEQTRKQQADGCSGFGDSRRGICLSGVRAYVRTRRRVGRTSQPRTQDRRSFRAGDEAPRTCWTVGEREEGFGREGHDSHIDSLTQVRKPEWNRPRRAADDALPRRNTGPRESNPRSERLARRSGAHLENALSTFPGAATPERPGIDVT
jgi:hypothetical protein